MKLSRRLSLLLADSGGLAPPDPPSTEPPTGAGEPLDFDHLEALRWIRTAAGAVPVIDRRMPPGATMGRTCPSDHADAAVDGLGRLLGDPRLDPFRMAGALFLDIEATGLSHGAGCAAFCIGIGFFEADGAFRTLQILQRDPSDELAALTLLADHLAEHPWLVSFNGKSYDLTVLQNRMVVQRLLTRSEASLKLTPHIDLLHVGRRLWGGLFRDCRLGTFEAHVLGAPRVDDLPGSEVPDRWFDFLQTGDARHLEPVLLHNLIDVRAMAALLARVLDLIARPSAYAWPEEVYHLGRWVYERGFTRRGLELLSRSLALPLRRGHRADAFRHAVRAFRREGRFEQLVGTLEAWRDHMPEIPDPFIELAKHYEHRLRDPHTALDHARAALERSPPSDAALRADITRRVARLERRCARAAQRR